MKPSAFFCLWEYVPPDKDKAGWHHAKIWNLVECYGVDMDGYACTESKYASDDRHSYDNWINQNIWYDEKLKLYILFVLKAWTKMMQIEMLSPAG